MAEPTETDAEKVKRLARWQRLGLAMLFLGGVAIVGFGVFVWSGLYNISAKSDHWRPTDWIIAQLRDRSIATRADAIDVPNLKEPGLAQLGAEHFRNGCATCHGEPGLEKNPVYANMLPEPPDLSHVRNSYDVSELFWIIYHGLKYTGMPAWPGRGRDDEVWPLVALLQHLDENGAESYRELITSSGSSNCARCHGDESASPISDLVPVLNGQSAEYLERALREYRAGKRQSGMMAPLAHAMTTAEIKRVAQFFSRLSQPEVETRSDADDNVIQSGEVLAHHGDLREGVPSCQSCHASTNPQYPDLAGQPKKYLFKQLQLFARGGRQTTGYGSIMTVIAERMSEQDMRAAAAYYAAMPALKRGAQRDE